MNWQFSTFNVGFSCPVRAWFRHKVTVFRTSVYGFGISCSPVVFRLGTLSCARARQVLLVACCVHGFTGFFDMVVTEVVCLAFFYSLGLVTFNFGMFKFLLRGLRARRRYGSFAHAGCSGLGVVVLETGRFLIVWFCS